MKPYEDVPDSGNMRVLRNVYSIEGIGTQNVILRGGITEEFWQKVIDTTNDYRVCAIGTPGIGKTSSTSVLIRLLLEQKRTVVYHIRTIKENGFVYVFTPSDDSSNKVDVQVIREKGFDVMSAKFNKPSIYYVVDPGKTKDSCDPPTAYEGNVVIVSSIDDRHWGESEFEKKRPGKCGMLLFSPVGNCVI